ncbi:hypothetical protein Tco_1146487 [Tanacetum coccineum]
MDRFKSESSHIKGVPPVLRISAFIQCHGHPKIAKKLNDKIPKTVDEMFERVRAFIRGEVAAGSAEMVRPSQGDKGYIRSAWSGGPEKARNRGGRRETRRNMGICTPYPRKDTFTPLIKTPKEILAMESGSRHQRLLLVKKANRGSCGLGEFGPASERYPLKQPEEREPRKEQCKGVIEGTQIRRILVDGGSLRKAGRNKTVLMEFVVIKCRSPYNVIIGRTGMKLLEAVGATIHSMIKFPTNQGIVTMETSREALWECKHLGRVQGSWKKVQWRQR